jgi:cation transport regulator ChaB
MEDKRNENGNRMVAYNAYETDNNGVIWCMVVENEAGYIPMTGPNRESLPWYLARIENHTDDSGKVNYKTLWENAERTVDVANKRDGYSREEVSLIVASSMRAQNEAIRAQNEVGKLG